MQTITQPSLLLKPFAEQGDKNTLPVTNTDPTEPQRADLTSGFPAIVSLPPDQGGLPPERKDFNALGYLTTTYDWFYQCGGTFTFDPTISTAIGGYPIGARLWYTNADGLSMILRSAVQNNTNNFLTDPSVIGNAGDNKPWIIENFMGIKRDTPLLSFNWFDHEPDDASWLKADTWSWQSGGVYKSAYDLLVDGYDNGTQTSDCFINCSKFGTLMNVDGFVSGFGSTNYLNSFVPFNPAASTWELNLKIKTHTSNGTGNQDIFNSMKGSVDYGIHIQLNTSNKLVIYLSSNGSSHDIASAVVGTTTLSANTIYYLKMVFSGSSYVLYSSTTGAFSGEEVTEITVSSSAKLYSGMNMTYIGTNGNSLYRNQAFSGSIDLKECNFLYNGSIKWTGAYLLPYTVADNGLKIVSVTNAGMVQDVFEEYGVAWYYILDKTNTQFKLPRTKFGFTGYRDEVGKYVEAGVPNITGGFGVHSTTGPWENIAATSGVFERVNKGTNGANPAGSSSSEWANADFNATRCSPVYNDSDTVQPPATQMYLYFYVGNTVRNQTEVDVGEVMEELNKKWDSSNMVVATALPEDPQSGVFYFIK